MSLYKYFPSKNDGVLAFLRKRDEDFRQWFVQQVDSKADTPKDKLLAIFDVIGEWMAIPEFRSYMVDLAQAAGCAEPESLALQLSLLIEGAIVSEQMKRYSGAGEYAKQAARVLIEGSLSQKQTTQERQ